MAFYQHMQSAEYRQDLEQNIAVETVRMFISFLSDLYSMFVVRH